MGTRLELNDILSGIMETEDRVYFQPPESLKIEYPCIVYNRVSGLSRYADNKTYTFIKKYDVTLIDRDPDSEYFQKIIEGFDKIRYDRHYVSNNLHHDVFNLYF